MSKSSQEVRISNATYAAGAEIERTSKLYTRNMVPSDRAQRVLDIGCGTGLNAKRLASMSHSVVGVDISPVAIEKLHEVGLEGKVCDVAEGLPFADESFDVVFASEVIEHLADTDAFLAEIHRVLRPEGNLILSTPNSAFWVFRVLSMLGYTATEVQHPGHVRFFSKRSLRRHLTDNGFVSIRISARHMYLVLGDGPGKAFSFLLRPLGCQREYRFKTKKHFWHVSRFAGRASSFWADTLIAKAAKRSSA